MILYRSLFVQLELIKIQKFLASKMQIFYYGALGHSNATF